jgi:uridine monophosphate synthetase
VTGFFTALEERARAAGSILCVGLDPRAHSALEARAQCLSLIAATAGSVACFKANAAFFEALGPPGLEALVEVVGAVPAEIPVILDAKRGDIASSAQAYAVACFDVIGAGAVTVSPYLGWDAIEPFLTRPGSAAWVLCRTSNPGSEEIQGLRVVGGGSVAERVAAAVAGWAGPDRLGLVVGATQAGVLEQVRAVVSEHWILTPGVGAQGAAPEDVGAGMRADGSGILVPVSRAIASAADPGAEAERLRRILGSVRPVPPRRPGIASDLHDSGCVRFGEFTLRSGTVSPVYVDLRRLVGHPDVMERMANAYLGALGELRFDHLGAVPYGAIPIATALALRAGVSLVWPRPTPKDHGTGVAVEGVWEAGDRVVLVDDVVTSGTSALEAARLLRIAGLVVEDLVVLVERTTAARGALAAEGIGLHAVTTLAALVRDLADAGAVTEGEAAAVEEFLRA